MDIVLATVEEVEANIVYSPEDSAQQPAADEKTDDEEDDLFSFIEDLNLDTLASSDSISASIDDLLPTPPAVEEKVDDKAEEENLEDFGGFEGTNARRFRLEEIRIEENAR